MSLSGNGWTARFSRLFSFLTRRLSFLPASQHLGAMHQSAAWLSQASSESHSRDRPVMFVFEFTNDFFQHVFERQQAQNFTLLVTYQRHGSARFAEELQRRGNRFFGGEKRG